MKEGDVLLAMLRQADGSSKLRRVILLRIMPPFNDFLVCGVSTQRHLVAPKLDELIERRDADFSTSGLKSESLIRVGYLAILPQYECKRADRNCFG